MIKKHLCASQHKDAIADCVPRFGNKQYDFQVIGPNKYLNLFKYILGHVSLNKNQEWIFYPNKTSKISAPRPLHLVFCIFSTSLVFKLESIQGT